MASSNQIVTKTVNRTTFEVDKASYNSTIKKIRSVKKEWEKAGEPISKPKNDPAKQYSKSADQIKLVNKRLMETRKREEERAVAHSIALAKKEARAKEQIQKQSAARIRQTMTQMTAKNPQAAEMRKFYQQQEREAKKANRRMQNTSPTPLGPMNIQRMNSVQLPSRGGSGTGMVGDSTKPYSPETIAKQNAEMARGIRQQSKAQDKATAEQSRKARIEANRQARIQDVMAQQRIRLSSKYGSTYNSTLGRDSAGRGIQDLNKQFKSGALSAGQYRQSIQALERQFRASQGAAMSFGSVLENVRTGLVSVGAAYGVFNTGAAVLQQGQFFQGLEASMLMVSNSSEEAGKRIQFVRDESYRLGLSLKEASQGYTQMAIAGKELMSGDQLNSLFSAYSEYSTALQVDPVRFQRGIMAIQQMMGKGQVMAEELKGQLSEAIPGSLDIFVKAAQEAFNDTTIDTAKFMKMMENGEITAKKLMPLIGKYFSEAANRGGALEKALQGNRVAMQRMQQSWINMQNAIFMGGFGDAMTKIFNDLSRLMETNMDTAKSFGEILGQLITGAWDAATAVYNAFVFMGRAIEYFAEKLGYQGDILSEMFDWAAYVAGVGLFIMALKKVYGMIAAIAGLRGALGGVRDALGGDLASGGKPGGPNTGGRGGSPWGKPTKGGGGWLGKIGGGIKGLGGFALRRNPYVTAAMLVGGEQLLSEEGQARGKAISEAMAPSREVLNPLAQATGGDMTTLAALAWNSLTGGGSKPSPNIDPDRLAQNAVVQTNPFPYPLPPGTQQQEGKITVEIKAGDLKQYIRAVVDENNMMNFNLLTQGGQN
ncbi:putative tape measure protein [Salmonella phage SSBI34]|nr:putative tape measure protein [Salmonella phage SSBI34]